MNLGSSTEASIKWSMKPTSKWATKSLGNVLIARGKDEEKDFNHRFRKFEKPQIYSSKKGGRYKFIRSTDQFNGN